MNLFPETFDNHYRGHKAGLWILGLLALIKIAMGTNVMFNGQSVAQNADGIPLSSYGQPAQQTILAFFALWGLAQVMLGVFGVVALVRYRAMTAFVLLSYLVEHASRKTIFAFLPIERVGNPPGIIVNYVLVSLMVVGLGSAVWRRSLRGV